MCRRKHFYIFVIFAVKCLVLTVPLQRNAFASDLSDDNLHQAYLSAPSEPFLHWNNSSPEVQLPDPDAFGGFPSVVLDAHTTLNDWNFLLPGQEKASKTKTLPDGSQQLRYRVFLGGPTTRLTILAVSPTGEVKEEKLVITYPGWKDWIAFKKNGAIELKRLIFTASLGISDISYSDAAISNYNEIALTPAISFRYWLKPKKWDLDGSMSFSALPLASNLSSVNARFLEINLRMGYLIPFVQEPWSLDLMGGFYYSKSFVTGSAFGYSNLLYPEFYPILRRVLTARNAIGIYLKVVPLGRLLSFDLSQHAISTGLQWANVLLSGHPVLTSLDYSSLVFLPSNASIPTNAGSLTLSVGYGF